MCACVYSCARVFRACVGMHVSACACDIMIECMRACACVCACTRSCLCEHVHAHELACARVRVCARVCARTLACMCEHVHAHELVCADVFVCDCVCGGGSARTCKRVCMCFAARVCARVCACVFRSCGHHGLMDCRAFHANGGPWGNTTGCTHAHVHLLTRAHARTPSITHEQVCTRARADTPPQTHTHTHTPGHFQEVRHGGTLNVHVYICVHMRVRM